MITVTEQKPYEEILASVESCQKVYIIGCGTCPTALHTGGKAEVLELKSKLEADGKEVTGWMVIPTACDSLAEDAIKLESKPIEAAECVLVMSCGFGVQNVSFYCDKDVKPALNSLFVGLEEAPGKFVEVCGQCGNCVLANTAGLCPVMRCAKGLFNGPCGGSVDGKCEVSKDTPCVWAEIYERLKAIGQLDKMDAVMPIQDWSKSSGGAPRRICVE